MQEKLSTQQLKEQTAQVKAEALKMEAENNYWKQQVLSEEFRSRYQKARYETMYYLLEIDKIEEAYKALMNSKFQVTEQKEVEPLEQEVENVG